MSFPEDGNIRWLQDEDRREPDPTFQTVFTVVVLVGMFAVLITDKIGTDSVMLTALATLYVANIISIKEALAGFSSQGLLTVLVLFVVAEGLQKTGALGWYVAKLLGRPRTISGAQCRVMIPIALLSGWINDTPLVTLSMPIILQWSRKVGISPRMLMMPLSFAALLGGVITLIGTSTNMVIAGLLEDHQETYGKVKISLLGIGQYGVPVSMVGIAYVVLATPLLLARKGDKQVSSMENAGDLLVGARVTQWSPAGGRTIRRSGLRDTGGVYLVSVLRSSTGNMHHAVGPEFVLSVGDILYFTTGAVEKFGEFCAFHGLEVATNEHQDEPSLTEASAEPLTQEIPTSTEGENAIGVTLSSLLEAHAEDCMRIIYGMEDAIRGDFSTSNFLLSEQNRVVVVTDKDSTIVAIDTLDRSGLLLDISKCLNELGLELCHTEAAVRNNHSLSIWRCSNKSSNICEKELWADIQALLAKDSGYHAIKQRGMRVLRARILSGGRLIGKKATSEFRQTYLASIVSIQKVGGISVTGSLSDTKFDAGDVLVLQADSDSPLLRLPPEGFYDNLANQGKGNTRVSSAFGLFRSKSSEQNSIENIDDVNSAELGHNETPEATKEQENVWKDLQVIAANNTVDMFASREFLSAMKVAKSSQLSGKSLSQAGIDKMPDIFLVSIERPVAIHDAGLEVSSFTAISLDTPLQEDDVLWFAGTATAIGDLRKIPGLISYESDVVDKMNTKAYERRLMLAVVALKGPLVGRTIREVRFRTRYGAAVIAVQREGERVHEHSGNIKLKAGDVLLLEAGPEFIAGGQHDRAFIMVSEVRDSAPPRLRMLVPALVITIGAYGCYMAKLAALWGCAMVAAILMIAMGIMSESEARSAIKWEIYTTIAGAFGISTALVNSGVAKTLADFLVQIGNAVGVGKAGLLGGVYLSTVLISQVVANNAAAALIFPIAMDAAKSTGTDYALMAYTIMLAASAAFMTPFGYQTNLMVMGPGGYTTMDFLIFGTPMQIVLLVATTFFLVAPFWASWLISFATLVSVAAFRILTDVKKLREQKVS